MDTDDDRGDPLGDVAFLARSASRVRVLAATAERPRTRHELRELTGASRVTVNRVADDLEDRGWIVREDGRCEATPQGAYVAGEFTRVLDDIETLDHLGEHVSWIPVERFDFDLRELRDAVVITPTWDDFAAYTRRLVELVADSTAIGAIATGLHREFVQALGEATVGGGLDLELVYPPEVIDAIRAEPDLCRLLGDAIDTGSAAIYRYHGADPLLMVAIHELADPREDVVLLCGQHEEDAPPGTIQTSNARVRTWAESYVASVREDSRRLDVEELLAGRPETT